MVRLTGLTSSKFSVLGTTFGSPLECQSCPICAWNGAERPRRGACPFLSFSLLTLQYSISCPPYGDRLVSDNKNNPQVQARDTRRRPNHRSHCLSFTFHAPWLTQPTRVATTRQPYALSFILFSFSFILLHLLYPITIAGTPEVAAIDNLDIADWQRACV
jgi:hypothetical protein